MFLNKLRRIPLIYWNLAGFAGGCIVGLLIYNSACFSLIGTDVTENFTVAGWRLDFTFETGQDIYIQEPS